MVLLDLGTSAALPLLLSFRLPLRIDSTVELEDAMYFLSVDDFLAFKGLGMGSAGDVSAP